MSLALREPLLFTPVIQDKLWGGDGLWRHLSKGDASQTRAGESWEVSDRREAVTSVAVGQFAGQSLRQLMEKAGPSLIGLQSAADKNEFPLLYKFICAREALSVQVHPGDNSPFGEAKTECWYVLDAPENAELILGVSQSLPREAMASILASDRCGEALRREPVKTGDMLFIPAGTVHAITAGLLIYELQQNSDTTFRLYDWGRLDDQGRPRALHLSQAAQVMDLRVHESHKIIPLNQPTPGCDAEALVACPYFALWRWRNFRRAVILKLPQRFRVGTVIRGGFAIEWPGGTLSAPLGSTVLFPADLPEAALSPLSGDSEILLSGIPDLYKEIVSPLRAAGHSDVAINALAGLDGLPAEVFAG